MNTYIKNVLETHSDLRPQLEQLLNPFDDEETLDFVIFRLRELRNTTPRASTITVDAALLPLMALQHSLPVDVTASSYIPPQSYDVLLTDIQSKDITNIAVKLERTNLSNAAAEGQFPAKGISYGDNQRLFLALTVKKRNRRVWVLFLLDTGSPHTFLREDTLKALGFTEHIPDTVEVHINGVATPASLSHSHFKNVNLLGQNYMKAAQLVLQVDYPRGTVALTKAGAPSGDE